MVLCSDRDVVWTWLGSGESVWGVGGEGGEREWGGVGNEGRGGEGKW